MELKDVKHNVKDRVSGIKGIISILPRKKVLVNLDDEKLLSDIDGALEELRRADLYFDMAKEGKMIEYAIHLQSAARTKYEYLLQEAKERKLRGCCKVEVIEVE